jgi:hypothetical protein
LDSTRRQPSASTIKGARSSPRSVCTVLPSRFVTVAVSNSVPEAEACSHSSAQMRR